MTGSLSKIIVLVMVVLLIGSTFGGLVFSVINAK
tara:strand:- start:395 stop:496 length:102 start_codon:yes stop_codon:yes gene_type:complete